MEELKRNTEMQKRASNGQHKRILKLIASGKVKVYLNLYKSVIYVRVFETNVSGLTANKRTRWL